MRRSSQTTRALIVTTLIMFIAGAGYGAFLLEIQAINRATTLLVSDLGVQASEEGKIRSIRNIVRDTEPERAELNAHFVNDDSVVDFLETIENLGVVADVSLDVVSVGIEGPLGDGEDIVEFLRLSLVAQGSFESIMHLLFLLESLPFIIEIGQFGLDRIVISDKGKNEWRGMFTFRVAKLRS